MKKKAKQLMYPGKDGMIPPAAMVSFITLCGRALGYGGRGGEEGELACDS